jgi:hypothetical protein
MRIAYVILAHQLPEQLVRLVGALDAPGARFLLHINRRSPDAVIDAARAGLAGRENVTFLRRHRLYWGGFGHVAATLEGIEELHRSGADYDYVVLLTGQDYPIKPVAEIERTLAASDGRSFMAVDRLPGGWVDGMKRIRYWHERRIGVPRGWHMWVPIRRRFPLGLEPWGGSSYWWLSRAAIDHVRAFLAEHPGYTRFFRHVDVPDEIFFHTILMNSPLRESVVSDELRLVDWSRETLPHVFGADDLEALRSSPKLVARKFDETVDGEILDLIDRELLG